MYKRLIPIFMFGFAHIPLSLAASENSFDLHCTGEISNEVKKTTTSWSNWIKIDLDTMQYCLVGCQSQPPGINPIQQVQADRIVLVDKDEQSPYTGEFISRIILNRTDGTVDLYTAMPAAGIIQKAHGICVKSKFTGFPATKF